MNPIETIIDRIKECGYIYNREQYAEDKIPTGINNKTFFITQEATNNVSDTFPINSISQIKAHGIILKINLIEIKSKTDYNNLEKNMSTFLDTILVKIPMTPKINMDSCVIKEKDGYILSEIKINLLTVQE